MAALHTAYTLALGRRWLIVLAWLAALLPAIASAAPGGLPSNVGHAESSPQWEKLRAQRFGSKPMVAGEASAIKLDVPLRAAYGASVPVKVIDQTAAGQRIAKLTLLVDKNPSPIAAELTLYPALPRADFETRMRVDEYSHIRVVAELADGSLHTDSRYVKVSGGCSAPPNRDKLHLIGKTQFRLPEALKPGAINPVEVSVIHPNDSGFELNQQTVMYIPAHFVRSLKVSLDGTPLFDSEQDFSISENPSWRFRFTAPANGLGVLRAQVVDSKDAATEGSLRIEEAAAAAGPASAANTAASPAATAAAAAHGMPAAYSPLIVHGEPQPGGQILFDLRPAQAQARAQGKRLYVYLNADDCGYCRRYEQFLHANAAALAPQFAKDYVVVSVQSSLKWRSPQLVFQTDAHKLPYAAFQEAIGDERARQLVYPNVWVMDASAKPLLQMPAGAGTFSTVDEQLEILKLVQ